jgi:transposase-like protein
MTILDKRRHEKYSLVEKYLQRSESLESFCKTHNISKSTLGYWICKYNREGLNNTTPSSFVKLTPKESENNDISIYLPNGIRITGSGLSVVSAARELYRKTA